MLVGALGVNLGSLSGITETMVSSCKKSVANTMRCHIHYFPCNEGKTNK